MPLERLARAIRLNNASADMLQIKIKERKFLLFYFYD
jgi:hypothetical protein